MTPTLWETSFMIDRKLKKKGQMPHRDQKVNNGDYNDMKGDLLEFDVRTD